MAGRVTVGTRRVRRALRVHGARGTLQALIRRMRQLPSRRRAARADAAFDEFFGVDTGGIVPLQGLDIDSGNRDLGVRYQATSPRAFRELIAAVGPVKGQTFVDLGAGKGRALVLASEHPFRRIIGVEFAPELCEVAQRNIARIESLRHHHPAFEVVCGDAADYELPDDPSLVFIYNAFEEPLMSTVLARIRESVERSPRHLRLALANPRLPDRRMREIGWAVVADGGRGQVYAPAPT